MTVAGERVENVSRPEEGAGRSGVRPLGVKARLSQLCNFPSPNSDEAEGEETRGAAAANAAAECAGKSPPPEPDGLATGALMEAAGIEPASADAPAERLQA